LHGDELRLLSDGASDYGIELSQHHLDLFHIYLDELWEWNRRINLTGLSTRDSIVIDLFLDSLIPAPLLPRKGRLLDVGSGAGFPGLPLKIYNPLLKTDLLEANSKKVSFLKQVIRLLGLSDIDVIKGRIETDVLTFERPALKGPSLEGHTLYPTGYHLITARALADLPQTLAWCAPFLFPDGLLVGFLGSRAEDDMKKSQRIMEEHSLVLFDMIPYILPGKSYTRNTVIFKKTA
jgi:16S rRNA (guanine527-N7)-methyltransferase